MPAAARLERCHIHHDRTCHYLCWIYVDSSSRGWLGQGFLGNVTKYRAVPCSLPRTLPVNLLVADSILNDTPWRTMQVSETEAPYLQWSKDIKDVLSWRVNRKKLQMCASCALALWFVYSACVVWASEHVNLWARFLAWPDRMRMKMSLRKHGNPRRPAQLPSMVTSRHFPSSFWVPWAKVGILPRLPQAWEARPFSSQSTASTLNTSTGYGESNLQHAPQRLWNQRHPSMISLDMIQFLDRVGRGLVILTKPGQWFDSHVSKSRWHQVASIDIYR